MRLLNPECTRLRPLGEYTQVLPSSRPGKRIHKSTLWRWATRGSRGVVLRTERLGNGRYTTDAHVAEFVRHLSRDIAAPRSYRPVTPSEDSGEIMEAFGLPKKTECSANLRGSQ